MSLKCILLWHTDCAVPGNIWSARLVGRMMTSKVISDLLSQMKEARFAATIPKFKHFSLFFWCYIHFFSCLFNASADSGFCRKSCKVVWWILKTLFVSKCCSLWVVAAEVSLLKAHQRQSLPSNSSCEQILCASGLNSHFSASWLWTASAVLGHWIIISEKIYFLKVFEPVSFRLHLSVMWCL